MMSKYTSAIFLTLAVSCGAFVAPLSSSARSSIAPLGVMHGPQTGGTDASSSLPDAYGQVSIDNPWGDRSINGAYYRGPAAPDGTPLVPHSPPRGFRTPNSSIVPAVMPIGRGHIATVTGGREGSSKYASKGDGTKWGTTKWHKNECHET